MRKKEVKDKLLLGIVAGLAGTIVIQGLQAIGQKAVPEEMPPMKQHPGEFMVEKAEGLLPPSMRRKIPRKLEVTAQEEVPKGSPPFLTQSILSFRSFQRGLLRTY
jgi:hypothetical protein